LRRNRRIMYKRTSHSASEAIKRRIVIGQSLYAFGALLRVFNNYAGIACIVLVQLSYVIAPRWRGELRE
jgi:hypothetical protein